MNRPVPTNSLSYGAVWNDAAGILRANAGLLAAIAGVFLFLPTVLEARYFPQPVRGEDWAQWLASMDLHFRRNLPWVILSSLAHLVGLAAIYILLLATPQVTVGGAVARAVAILPFFLVLTVIVNVATGLGLLLLIVPGIFLLGKLALATPILVTETPRAPLTALRRSWERTAGRSWSIAGLVVLVYIAAMLVSFAIQVGFGTMILLFLGREGIGALILALLQGFVGATVTVVATVLIVAIYRAVSAPADLGKRFA